MASSASVSIAGATRLDDIEALELREATGEFDVSGATVHYLRPMSPIENVSGRGRFDGIDLVIDITEGGIGNLKAETGRVILKDLGGTVPQDTARIEFTVAGPVREALSLLDQDPLNYISAFDIDPAETDGTSVTNAVFEFPLISASGRLQISVGVFGRRNYPRQFRFDRRQARVSRQGRGAGCRHSSQLDVDRIFHRRGRVTHTL